MSARKAMNGFLAQSVLANVKALAKARDLNMNRLSAKIYGEGTNSGKLYGAIHRAKPEFMAQLAAALEVPAETLLAPPPEVTSQPLAIPKFLRRAEPEGVPFSLTVHPDGTASIRLNLEHVPLDRAVQVLTLLELPTLFNHEPRRITHEKG